MSALWPDDERQSRRLVVSESSDLEIGRIGGRPPKAVRPTEPSKFVFFATVPIADSEPAAVSIFILRDYGERLRFSGALQRGGAVQFVVHASDMPREASAFDSPLGERSLVLQEAAGDAVVVDSVEFVSPRNKLGGRPHWLHWEAELKLDLDRIRADGHRHIKW